MHTDTVLRVGVYNNFNYTKRELSELDKYKDEFKLFVNSNSFVTITADYPSIVTINPYLDSWCAPSGDLSNLKACRVKWVEGAKDHIHAVQVAAVDWCLQHSIPVLLTFMRFAKRDTLNAYVADSAAHMYKFSSSYYRLTRECSEAAYARLCAYAKSAVNASDLVYACDLSGRGCPSCGNCARLTYGDSKYEVASLSLKCSGDDGECIFHCPDCWAKRLGRITKFRYDVVTVNNKQKGKADE